MGGLPLSMAILDSYIDVTRGQSIRSSVNSHLQPDGDFPSQTYLMTCRRLQTWNLYSGCSSLWIDKSLIRLYLYISIYQFHHYHQYHDYHNFLVFSLSIRYYGLSSLLLSVIHYLSLSILSSVLLLLLSTVIILVYLNKLEYFIKLN